ncbi:hypothetical protein QTP86_012930 [Hemibagrus guttatus]|nr:hypothetical protein QTP86_012930 [Hemibagrus guttatus]
MRGKHPLSDNLAAWKLLPEGWGAASSSGPVSSELCPKEVQVQDAHYETDCITDQIRGLGICVLNYRDDWLILAHSKAMAASHWDVVLAHMRGFHVLVHTDSTAVFAYMNHQSGLRSRPLCKLVLRPGEWWLHPQVVESVWQMYGRAEVDLFASEESTHCPLWYFFSAPLGLDALVQTWLRLRLYAFPLVALLPQVLARVHHDGVHLLLVAPRWPTRVWFSDLVSFLNGTPWEIPIRKDLLS